MIENFEDYKDFILSKGLVQQKLCSYYIEWVRKFLAFHNINKSTADSLNEKLINSYLYHLEKKVESWQVNQASEALRLFIFYLSKRQKSVKSDSPDSSQKWKQFVDEMTNLLRLKHRSQSTEKSYRHWLRLFYAYLKGKDPDQITAQDIRDFMSFLAVERKVAASTQNQAFNAILFFSRHILP